MANDVRKMTMTDGTVCDVPINRIIDMNNVIINDDTWQSVSGLYSAIGAIWNSYVNGNNYDPYCCIYLKNVRYRATGGTFSNVSTIPAIIIPEIVDGLESTTVCLYIAGYRIIVKTTDSNNVMFQPVMLSPLDDIPDIVTISAGESLTTDKKELILRCLENGGRLTFFGGTSGSNQYYNWDHTRIMCMDTNNQPIASTAVEWLKAGGTSGVMVIIFDCISSIVSGTITASQHSITIAKTPTGIVVNNPT